MVAALGPSFRWDDHLWKEPVRLAVNCAESGNSTIDPIAAKETSKLIAKSRRA